MSTVLQEPDVDEEHDSLAELVERLGDIPLNRIRLHPAPKMGDKKGDKNRDPLSPVLDDSSATLLPSSSILHAVRNEAGLKCWKLCVMSVASRGRCLVGMLSRQPSMARQYSVKLS